MYIKRYEETPKFEQFWNEYSMLLPRDITECTESALVKIKKGSSTPKHAHREEEQIYFILDGAGILTIDKEREKVEKGTIVYIPRNSEHKIESIGDEDLVYIYVAIWPKGIPEKEKEWKKAYGQAK